MFFLIIDIVLYSLSSDHLHNTKYVIGGLVLCQEIFRFYSLWSSLELQHFPVQELWLRSKKKLDLLGIVVLGVITAVGGGMIRDVLLGIHPPTLFLKPVYVTVAVIAAIIIFLLMRSKNISRFLLTAEYYDWTMNLLDAIGLGAFTVVGVNTSISAGQGNFQFLTIFLGVITGVGGGLLRDMMACEVPAILRKHVYACASIAGAVFYAYIGSRISQDMALILSAALVVVIRLLARHYKWNLPKCNMNHLN